MLVPPIEPADVDPRSFACPAGPYRVLVSSHAPVRVRVLDEDRVLCGFCRVPWPTLRSRIADLLIAERDRARLHPLTE